MRLKRPDRKGAWIKMVVPGGGADRAGLAADDVIVSFDGRLIADPNQLRWLASLAGVGKTVPVRVQRGDKVFEIRVTLRPVGAGRAGGRRSYAASSAAHAPLRLATSPMPKLTEVARKAASLRQFA